MFRSNFEYLKANVARILFFCLSLANDKFKPMKNVILFIHLPLFTIEDKIKMYNF